MTEYHPVFNGTSDWFGRPHVAVDALKVSSIYRRFLLFEGIIVEGGMENIPDVEKFVSRCDKPSLIG